jgi:uncharacterized protein YjbI with pentapeptide repeats
MSRTSSSRTKLEQAVRAIVLAEITRYKKETGENYPRWESQLHKYVGKGYFVSFTDIPKLGLNPVNIWTETPTGIYTYPLVQGQVARFATAREYALVVAPKPGIRLLTLSTYDDNQLAGDIAKLKAYAAQQGLPEEAIEKAHQVALQASGSSSATFKAGKVIWFFTMRIADELFKSKMTAMQAKGYAGKGLKLGGTAPVAMDKREKMLPAAMTTWAAVFRAGLGYEGVVDDTGKGIIYSAEPYQAVFFTANTLNLVELIKKPISVEPEIKSSAEFGHMETGRKVLQMIQSGKKKDFANMNVGTIVINTMTPWRTLKNFAGVSFSGSKFILGSFETRTLNSVNFSHAEFFKTDFRGPIFDNTSFDNISYDGVELGIAHSFSPFLRKGSSMKGATFINAHIAADFEGTNADNVTVTNSIWTPTAVEAPSFENSKFTGCAVVWRTRGASYDNSTFTDCQFTIREFEDRFKFSAKNCTFKECRFVVGGYEYEKNLVTQVFKNTDLTGSKFIDCEIPDYIVKMFNLDVSKS